MAATVHVCTAVRRARIKNANHDVFGALLIHGVDACTLQVLRISLMLSRD